MLRALISLVLGAMPLRNSATLAVVKMRKAVRYLSARLLSNGGPHVGWGLLAGACWLIRLFAALFHLPPALIRTILSGITKATPQEGAPLRACTQVRAFRPTFICN